MPSLLFLTLVSINLKTETEFQAEPILLAVEIFHLYCYLKLIHVRYFGTLFWDDITKFWDENL